jgi:hypothetical protein
MSDTYRLANEPRHRRLCQWFKKRRSRIRQAAILPVMATARRLYHRNFPDLLFTAGVLLLSAGLALIYPPAALIAVGGILCTLGIKGAHAWDSSRD